LDNLKALPDLHRPNQETIIHVSGSAYRYLKTEVVVRAVRIRYPDVIINTCRPKVRTSYAIIQRHFCTQWSCADTALHEYPIANKQGFELFIGFRESLDETIQLVPCRLREVALKAANPADIG